MFYFVVVGVCSIAFALVGVVQLMGLPLPAWFVFIHTCLYGVEVAGGAVLFCICVCHSCGYCIEDGG